MGRRKKVTLDFTGGKGFFLEHGTDLVKEPPVRLGTEFVIEGDGFKIICNLIQYYSTERGAYFVDAHVEYNEDIKQEE